MILPFTKMHGLGNDFIVIALSDGASLPKAAEWRSLANRHTGIGFDQALVILPPRDAETKAFYRIFNADGGEVEQCGNGARCVAEWLRLEGRLGTTETAYLGSPGGRIEAHFMSPGIISINMGEPQFAASGESVLDVGGAATKFTEVSMGNPHIVLRVADVATAPVSTLGRALENHLRFPNRTNVGFLQVIDRQHARLRVFERGVGETQACGTGACAAMAVGRRGGWFDEAVDMVLPGGSLQLRWAGEGHPMWMTGPAAVSFRGEVEIS